MKPWPSSAPSRFGRQRAPRRRTIPTCPARRGRVSRACGRGETRRVLGLDDDQRSAFGAGRVGLGDDDDEIGGLAVGDESLLPLITYGCRSASRWCARLAGRSRRPARSWRWRRRVRRSPARQPAPFLLLRAVVIDVGRDDGVVQRSAESVEAAERKLGRTRLHARSCRRRRHIPPASKAEQSRRAGLAPHLARIEMVFMPFLQCGPYSAAMKRRAVSSKSTTSSLIHAGRGRLRTSVMWDITKRWSSAKYDDAAVHWQRAGVGALQAIDAECAYS